MPDVRRLRLAEAGWSRLDYLAGEADVWLPPAPRVDVIGELYALLGAQDFCSISHGSRETFGRGSHEVHLTDAKSLDGCPVDGGLRKDLHGLVMEISELVMNGFEVFGSCLSNCGDLFLLFWRAPQILDKPCGHPGDVFLHVFRAARALMEETVLASMAERADCPGGQDGKDGDRESAQEATASASVTAVRLF